MTLLTLTHRIIALAAIVVLLAAIVVLLAACSAPPEPLVTPEPTPSVLMKPVEADNDAAFYGVGATDIKSDKYGEYAALAITKVGLIADLTGVTIDPAVYDHFDPLVIEKEAIYLADFLVGSYIDTPLVFDDSAAVRDQYWADTAVKWGDVDFMRSYFDGKDDAGPWALVDDNRGEWRQNGEPAYEPAPYVQGEPRTKLQSVRLVSVSYDEIEWNGVQAPVMKYRFSLEYDREVLLDGGEPATEHTAGHVTITAGWLDGLTGTVVGLGWGRSTSVGHYIDGGTRGLHPLAARFGQADMGIEVGADVTVPALEGFATVSDLARGETAGIQVASADAPDAVVGYYEGPAFGDPADPEYEYLFTVYDPSPIPDELRPSDAAREEAGEYGEDEYFLPQGGTAHRLVGQGIERGYLAFDPAMFDETHDSVTLWLESTEGPTSLAVYWVEKGSGHAVRDQVAAEWRMKAPREATRNG